MTRKPTPLPSADYLRECFDYDPKSGSLRWRARPLSHFQNCKRDSQWEMRRRNSTMAGKEFGSPNTHGHIKGTLDGRSYYAHRIIWKIVNGSDPTIIDHFNGTSGDNKKRNLRNGSRRLNQRNTKLPTTNTSGRKGVYKHGQSDGWCARIHDLNGKNLSKYSKDRSVVERWRSEKEREFGYTDRGITA